MGARCLYCRLCAHAAPFCGMTYSTLSFRSLVRRTFWTVVVACVCNSLLAFVGALLSRPPSTFAPYQYFNVIGLTSFAVVGAAVVYALVRRRIADTVRANRFFTYVTLVVLVFSLYPNLLLPWSTDPAMLGWTYGIMINLSLMHAATAALVLYYFTKRPLR